jgi:hypothetical protein
MCSVCDHTGVRINDSVLSVGVHVPCSLFSAMGGQNELSLPGGQAEGDCFSNRDSLGTRGIRFALMGQR